MTASKAFKGSTVSDPARHSSRCLIAEREDVAGRRPADSGRRRVDRWQPCRDCEPSVERDNPYGLSRPETYYRICFCFFSLNAFFIECSSVSVFGLFDMVTVNNRACRALTGEIGTCLSYAECFAFRGNVSGTCGRGFGFCCVSTFKRWMHVAQEFRSSSFFLFADTKTCQGVVYANNTYFVNPGYPNSLTSPGQCYVTVNRLAPTICQVR